MFQSDLLRHKRILITGGGTGLGKAMAQRFLELGATVYICGRRHEVLAQTVAEFSPLAPGRIHSAVCDVRDLPRLEETVSTIWKNGPLNIVVNNAAGNFMARTEELSPGAFEAVLGIVLMGTINVTMACGRKWLLCETPRRHPEHSPPPTPIPAPPTWFRPPWPRPESPPSLAVWRSNGAIAASA